MEIILDFLKTLDLPIWIIIAFVICFAIASLYRYLKNGGRVRMSLFEVGKENDRQPEGRNINTGSNTGIIGDITNNYFTASQQNQEISLSEFEYDVLSKWVKSGDISLTSVEYTSGEIYYRFGLYEFYADDSRKVIEAKSALDKYVKYGFVAKEAKINKKGKIYYSYELRQDAIDYINVK